MSGVVGPRFSPISTLWNDLLAYYTADNTPNDSLGNYNGTLLNGATYGTGIINQGFSLDGVNDYVDFGNNFSFDVNNAFSFSFWVKPSNSNWLTIFSKIDSLINKGYIIRKKFSTNEIQVLLVNDGSNYSVYESTGTLTVSTLQLVTITYDGLNTSTSCKMYINGTSTSVSRTVTGTGASSITNSTSARIGVNNQSSGVHYWSGIIDEVGIWDRELTADEVTDLYNSGSGLQYT